RLEQLKHDGEIGRLVREGVTVAIVGPPNAGKSSLLNALLGEERALVSEIAGTTRDTIEESITVHGMQMRLIDTAGIRNHADRLEAAGIERTRRALADARVALVVVDGSQTLGPEARRILRETANRPRVVVANKADLGTTGADELAHNDAIVGSVRDAPMIRALHDALTRAAWNGELPDLERPHLAAAYELEAVRAALEALADAQRTLTAHSAMDFLVGDLHAAFAALGHITGDVASEEIVTGVFARFCIGK
ncbi:MAG: 50S ribosome-binding GTPase, partial [Candidatus Eremiobacteraeota bacterium]|nr:50S ribosome-binding GTPase [Candidatus Eremiobacteraeota bacterium]